MFMCFFRIHTYVGINKLKNDVYINFHIFRTTTWLMEFRLMINLHWFCLPHTISFRLTEIYDLVLLRLNLLSVK